jgi:hypothetical protein
MKNMTVFNETARHEDVWGNGIVLSLGTTWGIMISFTLQQF